MNKHSFLRGFGQVPQARIGEVRELIMMTLAISTRTAFRLRLNGRIIPRPCEIEAIERIFHGYGITDIWGEEDKQ